MCIVGLENAPPAPVPPVTSSVFVRAENFPTLPADSSNEEGKTEAKLMKVLSKQFNAIRLISVSTWLSAGPKSLPKQSLH